MERMHFVGPHFRGGSRGGGGSWGPILGGHPKMTSCRRGGGGVRVRMTNNVEGCIKKA